MAEVPAAVKRQGDAARLMIEQIKRDSNALNGESSVSPTETPASSASPAASEPQDPSQPQTAAPADESFVPQTRTLPWSEPPAPSQPDSEGLASAPDGRSLQARYDQLQQDYGALERRYLTLQGKYDREVPRLHAELRELRQRIDQQTPQPQAATPDTPQAPDAVDQELATLREKLADAFGNEEDVETLFQAIQRLGARGDVTHSQREELDALRAELADIRQREAQREVDARQKELTRLAPNWQTINQDPRFTDRFLNVRDPASGQLYRELMQSAYNAGEVDRAAWFFQEFERQTHQGGSHHQGHATPSPGQHPAPEPQTGRVPTLKELTDVCSHQYTRQWKGDPQELKRLQDSARRAIAEGRYRLA